MISPQELTEADIERHKMLFPLKEACMNCKMCELGWSKAKKNNVELDPHVFSSYTEISMPSKFMIIGQNPGWTEVEKKTPFIGPSGKNFDDALKSTIWTRDWFYITNAAKCFTANNMQPSDKQLSKCELFLRMELEIVKPILLVAFGAVAFNILCDGNFSENIGKIYKKSKYNIPVFTTYHPSPMNLSDQSKKKIFNRDIVMLGKIMNHYLSPF